MLIARPAWLDDKPRGNKRRIERVVADLEPMILYVAGLKPAGPWRAGLTAGGVAEAQRAVKVWEQGNPAPLRHEIAAAVVCDGKMNGERLKAAVAAAGDKLTAAKVPWFLMDAEDLQGWLAAVAAPARVRVWDVAAWCRRVEGMAEDEGD